MLGFVLAGIVLSLVGALAMRGVVAALGLEARLVVGLGPRLGKKRGAARGIEVRPIPLWVTTQLLPGGSLGRELAARLSAPAMILLVPFALVACLVMLRGEDVSLDGPPLVLGVVAEGSPAEAGGLEPGDVVREVEGRSISDLASLVAAVAPRGGEPTHIVVTRAGERRELTVVPAPRGGPGRIGVRPAIERRAVGPLAAASVALSGITRAWSLLVPRGEDTAARGVAGPIGITRAPSGARPDGLTVAIALGLAWTAFAPLVALLSAVGQLIQAVRMRVAKSEPEPELEDETD